VTEPSDDRDQALAMFDRVGVSRETVGRLDLLVQELSHWKEVKNLIGPAELGRVWTRHIVDSAQLLELTPDAERWLDLGSGGGFPGLVLGIILKDRGRGEIDLIEANGRKCAFLRHAARVTGARAHVRQGRVEDLVGNYVGKVDVVTARAVASLTQLLDWSKDLLRSGTIGIFHKGRDVEAELTQAAKSWKLEVEQRPSLTDREGRIVIVRSLEPRSAP
jgi:16S rRNA (guanine527-N7)-methyltransferase